MVARLNELVEYFGAGGTLAGLYGLNARELEAVYTQGYRLYNQGRWMEALQMFSFLAFQDHLERRYQVARAGCLQMLKRYEDALSAYGLASLMDATDPEVLLHMAECLLALRRRDDAQTALEAIAALTDGDGACAPIRARAAALCALIQP
jgi:type III secretion system low calcium response chaperone LcrH/SycD